MLVWMMSSIEHTRDEMRELETLLSRIAQGDKEALGMLYERTHGAIYGFALSLVRRPSDAEDILQETFLRVYAAAERYRPEGKPMAWMMTGTQSARAICPRKNGSAIFLQNRAYPQRTGCCCRQHSGSSLMRSGKP